MMKFKAKMTEAKKHESFVVNEVIRNTNRGAFIVSGICVSVLIAAGSIITKSSLKEIEPHIGNENLQKIEDVSSCSLKLSIAAYVIGMGLSTLNSLQHKKLINQFLDLQR